MATSKSSMPPSTCGGEVVGADDVGAGGAGLGGGVAVRRTPRRGRPCRCPTGSATVPRTIWSALRGSTPSRTASSTVSSNLRLGQALAPGRSPRPACAAARGRTAEPRRGTSCLLRHVASGLPRCVRGPPARCSRRCGAAGCRRQTTLMPIDRAVPATCFLAASRSLALRSGILILAISATCASVTVPTPSRPGCLAALVERRRPGAAAPASAGSSG